MAPKHIKNLIEKYWEGNTSPAEEATLKTWYATNADGSDSETERYFSMLGNFNKIKSNPDISIELPENRDVRRKNAQRKINFSYLRGIAALLVVGLGFGLIWKMQTVNGVVEEEVFTQEEIQESYEEAKSALLLIAAKLNKGKDAVSELDKFSETRQRISE